MRHRHIIAERYTPRAQTVLPPAPCDAEVSAMMTELSHLQTFLTLHGASFGPEARNFIAAADLVQRTRILIVERCFRKSATTEVTPCL